MIRADEHRVFIRGVTYGPFPQRREVDPALDFARIRAAGFNAVRLYSLPDLRLLDAAAAAGLRVFAGLKWEQGGDFRAEPARLSRVMVSISRDLPALAAHPALAGLFVANEIPADIVRWIGPTKVRELIDELIISTKSVAPKLLTAYANYPSTEFLEPNHADFTAMNVYLEDRDEFAAYLRRLHHIAGDRPLVITEFGLDSRRNGTARQAETLAWAVREAWRGGAAGIFVYSWCDAWWNGGAEVLDWDFGLTDRAGLEKPAFAAVRSAFAAGAEDSETASRRPVSASVIVCTYNGASRIADCLRALRRQTAVALEIIVVDDGSSDRTADLVAREFSDVKLLRLPRGGLGRARNAGAAASTGDWLVFTDDDCEPDRDWLRELIPEENTGAAEGNLGRLPMPGAVGGPNLPPASESWVAAACAAAPGSASHVMADDLHAEHLPGCNLAISREAFEAIGGFDVQFHTAGDDVDICWRLLDADYRLEFRPLAFVWHQRRPQVAGYLRQQIGYGKAERLLKKKHPHRFTRNGGARWSGWIYDGGTVRLDDDSVVYHGTMGTAGYQGIIRSAAHDRPLPIHFERPVARLLVRALGWLQPRLRAWARGGPRRFTQLFFRPNHQPATDRKFDPPDHQWQLDFPSRRSRESVLQEHLDRGYIPGPPTALWDLEWPDGRKPTMPARMAIAIETGDSPGMRVLMRTWLRPAKRK